MLTMHEVSKYSIYWERGNLNMHENTLFKWESCGTCQPGTNIPHNRKIDQNSEGKRSSISE